MGYPDCYPYNQSDDSIRFRTKKLEELEGEIKLVKELPDSKSKVKKLKELKESYQLWWSS